MLLYIYKLYTTDKRYEDKRITLKLNFTLFALSKKMSKIIIFFIQSYDLIKYYIDHNVVLR